MKTICFTGHRKIMGFYDGKYHNDVRNKLVDVCKRAYEHGFTHFISGGALGVDMLGAEAVLHLITKKYMPLVLEMALPNTGQGQNWPIKSQVRLQNICIGAETSGGSTTIVSPGDFNIEMLQKRNEYMVDKSDAVIAVWDGKKGGTANCVAYATACGLPILVIHPVMLHENWINVKK